VYQIDTMKKMLPLRKIEYSVPIAAKSTRHVAVDGEIGHEHPAILLNVQIDFQSGQFQLEGNWRFIMSSNKHSEKHWFRLHRDRVKFTGTVFPGQAIDLSEATTGAAYAVEGMLSDGDSTAEYSGLLLLDQVKKNKTPGTQCWQLNLYLYNSESDDCEIKLSWTFFPAAEFSALN
jgi:hypothetical protein